MIAQTWLNAPNLVTVTRLLLAPAVIVEILRGAHAEAAVLFAIAAFTDFLDGWIARVSRSATRTGQYLDPIADKILLTGVFVALAVEGSVPIWYVSLVLGRDIAILAASALAMSLSSYDDYAPTVWGKISTLFQVVTAVLALTENAVRLHFLSELTGAAVMISGAATAWSAAHYTWRGVSFFARR